MHGMIIGRRSAILLAGVSIAALLASAPAAAQDAPPRPASPDAPPPGQTATATPDTVEDTPDTVVVTGVRRSLESAQNLKLNASTVIDSLSATDIGAFPDRSVAESLQRIPGITVSRFASPTDTQHLTGDPGQVVVRGLTQVATRVNGRESFSVNPQRGLNFADITPELLSQVDVYKNQTADLIEGGIGGTIDLHTRVPFEQKGQLISITAAGAYETLSKSGDPDISALYSNRWHTGIGEFGFLVSGAYTRTHTDSQNEQLGQTVKVDRTYFGTPTNTYIPGGIYYRDANYDRERIGVSAAAQWRSDNGKYEATIQYNLADYTQEDNERALTQAFTESAYSTGASQRYACNTAECLARYNPAYDYTGYYAPVPGTGPFQFDRSGKFVFGTPSDRASDYGGYADSPVLDQNGNQVIQNGVPLFRAGPRNAAGQPLFSFIQPNTVPVLTNDIRSAQQTWTQGIYSLQHDRTQDLSGHFRARPSSRLTLDLDYQYVFADATQQYRSAEYQTFTTITADLRGAQPRFSINSLTPYNFNASPGGSANPNNYTPRDYLDQYYEGNAHSHAVRLDANYRIGSTWLDSVQLGGRYSDREQEFDNSTYNWGSGYATWNSNAPANAQLSSAAYNGLYQATNVFSGYFNGSLRTDAPFIFPNPAVLRDRTTYNQRNLAAEQANSPNFVSWEPICSNTGARAGETLRGKVGCYLPAEQLRVDEKTEAAYLRINFGGPDARVFGPVTLSGNVGVRAVHFDTTSSGGRAFTGSFTPINGNECQGRPTDNSTCYATPADLQFFQNGAPNTRDGAEFWRILPSVNFRFKIGDKLINRYSYSRSLAQSDIGNLRNYQSISIGVINNTTPGAAQPYTVQFTGNVGNPRLRPTLADNFDVTLEYYFAKLGSVTVDGFYKKFHDFITNGSGLVNVTNNGATVPVLFTQPVNAQGGSLDGVEFAATRVFDFLPGRLRGFGVQGSVTLIETRGLNASRLNPSSNSGAGVQTYANPIDPRALVGISPTSYTVTGFYDLNGISGRLAYAYRSDYLLSVTDANNPYPFWQKGNGYLDGSLQVQLTKHILVTADASNILGTKTIVQQQVETAPPGGKRNLQPYAYQRIDRRFGGGVRIKF